MAKRGSKGSAKSGLVNRSNRAENTGVKLKGPSVNNGATRDGVAATPKTLGPRKA